MDGVLYYKIVSHGLYTYLVMFCRWLKILTINVEIGKNEAMSGAHSSVPWAGFMENFSGVPA
jgi:hypothetical protein